ncbi:MAG: Protein-export membrane protein SecD (TC 3.A.5.1.1) [uncultured Thiotrichaceae bacterium]|uniref:Protein translocase subunit SecD n=1 Tax=uncultured Thiotrichaceae bacterium TaxID=298394 RepID=A0A6S6T1A7_9GAMM|nr:MAG: Protein-export membrane protein SecD (TC 3.A.5.1.1) [uncultured Thiotrichaceae bacterium]
MNRYPLWKYLIIGLVALVGLIYASPILFPSDHAVQVSPAGKNTLTEATVKTIETRLAEEGLAIKKMETAEDQLLIRFAGSETQLKASKVIREAIGEEDYITALNLAPTTPAWLRSLNAKPMYMGLDLRGGVHFLMEVDMDTAIKKAMNNYKDAIRDVLIKKKIRYLGVSVKDQHLEVKFKDAESAESGQRAIAKMATGELDFSTQETAKGVTLIASLKESTLVEKKRFALQQNITTLRNRVNELGVSEPVIQQQGLERIIVQLPGIQDTGRAKQILGATATLEFRKVDVTSSAVDAARSGQIPRGTKLFQDADGNPVLLRREVIIAGEQVTSAAAGFDAQSNSPSVNLRLDGKGSKRMFEFTTANVQQFMGVVYIETKIRTENVDGELVRKKVEKKKVINQAQIREPFGKSFQITGLDSPAEAHNLALLLRAGALAAPVYIVEERTVGPSLGQANIDAGFKSVVLGFVLVLIFMAVYYKVFGLVANLALALNLVLIVAVLSMLQATLTLPGIAGIVLTVGMAVDANVLIYERIREEIRNGLSPQAAINSGYGKALSTIADANITTLIAAVVLYAFGTGPIKGFAIVLAIGIMSSMFTSIMGTRSIINLIYGNRKVSKLHI